MPLPVARESDEDAAQFDFVPFLDKADRPSGQRASTALIVLNSPITDIQYFERLHSHTTYRIYADGGANRVHDLVQHYCQGNEKMDFSETLSNLAPDGIHGDLDSLREDARFAYEKIGVHITRDPDQYSTDFGKAIMSIQKSAPRVREILVLGSLGGRVDQGVGLLHELLREQKFKHPEFRFWLFTETNVTMLLAPGRSMISTPLSTGLIERNVGILPLYGKANISISGFEWDVSDWPTEMGGQVSTSNHIVAEKVMITTDKEVLFTVERKC